MSTHAAHTHERTPGPTEAERILDGLARDLETIIRCATGPKQGRAALARGNMVMLAAEASRRALVALLVNDHHFTPDAAESDARLALTLAAEQR